MDAFDSFIESVIELFGFPLFTMGQTQVTVWTLVYLLGLIFLLFYLTAKLNRILVYRLMAKSNIDVGERVAIASFIRYVVLTIGFIIILQSAGIDLTSITVLVGALGVGIGFGLQTIVNNLVSGFIIFVERPIKVGDRIEIAGVVGNVVDISMRATQIRTNDNISIIVPNSEFISSTVINWSHSDRNVRFNFHVAVAYESDAEFVREQLLEVAASEMGVLMEPPPDVLLHEYADSGIVFNLRVWTREYTDRPGVLQSKLYYAIQKRFRESGIVFPFPQRDVYIKQMPDHLRGTAEAPPSDS
jgi:small-conductance mechanosensitive channel